jgi:glutathione S-transferase
MPQFDSTAPQDAKRYALEKGDERFALLDAHLAGREYLLDAFSAADAYLVTVLNWTAVTPIDLKRWPAVKSYHERLRARPSVAKAMAEELVSYQAQQARHRAA